MIWPFKRKPRPSDHRRWSEDWRPGDKAVCVADVPRLNKQGHLQPQLGEVLTVGAVREDILTTRNNLVHAITFDEAPYSGWWWDNRAFRKLRANERSARDEWRAMLSAPAKVEPDPIGAWVNRRLGVS